MGCCSTPVLDMLKESTTLGTALVVIVYTRTGSSVSVTTTQAVLAINRDITHGKRCLHYYCEGYTLLITVALLGGCTCVHIKYPVHALVHPCITVACVYCYHTHLAVTIYTCTLLQNHKQQQVCQCSHVLFSIATCILTAV